MELYEFNLLGTIAFHLDINDYLLKNFCRKLSDCESCPYPNVCDFNMKLLEKLEKTIDNEKII
jgi:hypothetical protein